MIENIKNSNKNVIENYKNFHKTLDTFNTTKDNKLKQKILNKFFESSDFFIENANSNIDILKNILKNKDFNPETLNILKEYIKNHITLYVDLHNLNISNPKQDELSKKIEEYTTFIKENNLTAD